MTPLITLHQVTKVYKKQPLFQDVSFSLQSGECVALTGANGCGKSTLLRIIAGLTAASGGTITRKTGLKIQYVPDIFPRLSLRQRQLTRVLERIDCVNFSDGLHTFSLPESGEQALKTYSKGMLSKIALLQALYAPVDILLLDEPGSGLDAGSRERFIENIRAKLSCGVGVVLATHGQAELQVLAHRVLRFDGGRLMETEPTNSATVPCAAAVCDDPATSFDPMECLCTHCMLLQRGQCPGRGAHFA